MFGVGYSESSGSIVPTLRCERARSTCHSPLPQQGRGLPAVRSARIRMPVQGESTDGPLDYAGFPMLVLAKMRRRRFVPSSFRGSRVRTLPKRPERGGSCLGRRWYSGIGSGGSYSKECGSVPKNSVPKTAENPVLGTLPHVLPPPRYCAQNGENPVLGTLPPYLF